MFREMTKEKESGIEKLIELLNEYEKDGLNEFEKYTERWYCERTKQILCGKWENNNELTPYEIISKQYGFIKWLVENEKIEYRKIIEKEIEVGFKLVRIKDYPNKIMEEDVEELLMLLSIQDEPIEFLVSILK